MSKELSLIILVLSSLLLGILASHAAGWIARRVHNPIAACRYSMMIGIALVAVLLVIAYWVIPGISRAVTGDAVGIGAII